MPGVCCWTGCFICFEGDCCVREREGDERGEERGRVGRRAAVRGGWQSEWVVVQSTLRVTAYVGEWS